MTKRDTKLVYETPWFVGQGAPFMQSLWMYTYPPTSGFEPMISKEETHVFNHYAHSGCINRSRRHDKVLS
jgi:hypothetical protein